MSKHDKIVSILLNGIFCVQILLLFLLIAENKLVIPDWLQTVGRLHPAILHLPIGLFFSIVALQFIKPNIDALGFEKIQAWLIYLTSLLSGLAAVMGFFLAQENGYDDSSIQWHKWTGIIFSFLMYYMAWQVRNGQRGKPHTSMFILGGSALLLTGHLGGEITHGKGFVLAPIKPEKSISLEDSSLYVALVKPIFESKCISCHNEQKAKGELIMTSRSDLEKGGKNGVLWDVKDVEESLLLHRLRLDISDKKHMPPRGKIQPSAEEVALLSEWIKQGADFNKKLDDCTDTGSRSFFKSAMDIRLAEIKKAQYEFAFAEQELIRKLNTPFCTVTPIAANSPALLARIFIRANYQQSFLTDLLQIRNQLVSLDLSNLPIADDDLQVISQFINLERLNLNGTDVEGKTLALLSSCKKLKALSLANTKIGESIRPLLEASQSLEQVYTWNTQLSTAALDRFESDFDQIAFDRGFSPDSGEVLQLTPPILGNESLVVAEDESIILESLLPGVTVRYTTDGSEPDSLSSPLYESPILPKRIMNIKAKAFANGWKSSETADFLIFKSGHRAKNIQLITANDQRFPGSGPAGLIDFEKGNAIETLSPLWLGFREHNMEAIFELGDPVPSISELVVSYALNIRASMLPPKRITIYGANQESEWKELQIIQPILENRESQRKVDLVSIEIPGSYYRYYRVIAEPYKKLPNWHDRRGKEGWLLVDEVFFY